MDSRLQDRLDRWHKHIEVVGQAEKTCLLLESQEKPLWSQIFLNAEGKTVAEREAKAYASEDWRSFQMGLVESRAAYNQERRVLELKQAAFQSEYLGAKMENEAIQRHPRAF